MSRLPHTAIESNGWIRESLCNRLLTDSDRMNETWISCGGWSFVLSTSKWTLLTFFTPWWIDIVLLPLMLIGLLGWRGPVGTRLAMISALYVLAFLIAGRPDNSYWGLMYAPLLPLGLLQIPRCLADLWRSALAPASTEP